MVTEKASTQYDEETPPYHEEIPPPYKKDPPPYEESPQRRDDFGIRKNDAYITRELLLNPKRFMAAIVPHRGVHGQYGIDNPEVEGVPENSRISILLAGKFDFKVIELDIKLTSDGKVVLHHDFTLGRGAAVGTALGKPNFNPMDTLSDQSEVNPRVDSMTMDQIRQFKLRAPSGEPTKDTVLSVQDALDILREFKLPLVMIFDGRGLEVAVETAKVLARNKDFNGRSYLDSSIFKMSANEAPNPEMIKQAFNFPLADGKPAWTQTKLMLFFNTQDMGRPRLDWTGQNRTGEHVMKELIAEYAKYPFFGLTEINQREVNGHLASLNTGRNPETNAMMLKGSYNPSLENPKGYYHAINGSCCYRVDDLIWKGNEETRGDGKDNRESLEFLFGEGVGLVTTDDPFKAMEFYRVRGVPSLTDVVNGARSPHLGNSTSSHGIDPKTVFYFVAAVGALGLAYCVAKKIRRSPAVRETLNHAVNDPVGSARDLVVQMGSRIGNIWGRGNRYEPIGDSLRGARRAGDYELQGGGAMMSESSTPSFSRPNSPVETSDQQLDLDSASRRLRDFADSLLGNMSGNRNAHYERQLPGGDSIGPGETFSSRSNRRTRRA
jgi:glycerophosphoryl diester phosphodiesterase